jgi:hypothetical protein
VTSMPDDEQLKLGKWAEDTNYLKRLCTYVKHLNRVEPTWLAKLDELRPGERSHSMTVLSTSDCSPSRNGRMHGTTKLPR